MSSAPRDASGRRPRGRPGHDRATVLRCAIEVFNARGYDATSVSDLAAALGVTKSAIYHHFASKQDLLAAALDEALSGLDTVVSAAATGTGPAALRLRATVRTAVRILAAHREAVTLLLRVRGNSALERSALERRRHIDEQLAALVRRAADDGDLRADIDPDVASRLVFGMVNSLVDWYSPDGAVDADGLADAVCHVLFEGLDAPRPPA